MQRTFGNILILMLLGIHHYWCTKVNLSHNFTYTTVGDLPTLLMTFSTIVIVFTIVICSCTIMIVVDFSYHPALLISSLLLKIHWLRTIHEQFSCASILQWTFPKLWYNITVWKWTACARVCIMPYELCTAYWLTCVISLACNWNYWIASTWRFILLMFVISFNCWC